MQFAHESFGICHFCSSWLNLINPRVLKITVTNAVCAWRGWTLPLLRFECERMQLVYEIILLNTILRNHLLSENLQWNYGSFNVYPYLSHARSQNFAWHLLCLLTKFLTVVRSYKRYLNKKCCHMYYQRLSYCRWTTLSTCDLCNKIKLLQFFSQHKLAGNTNLPFKYTTFFLYTIVD